MTYLDDLPGVLDSLARTTELSGAAGFIERNRALERVELHLAELAHAPADESASARAALQALRDQLQHFNDREVHQLRQDILAARRPPRSLAVDFQRFVTGSWQDQARGNLDYDDLDVLVAQLLATDKLLQDEDVRWEPEMVPYQPTPARVILDLVRHTRPSENDVFVDIGSGLGTVPILVSLLSHARAVGIEFQPIHCDLAQRCASLLQLPKVRFVCQDARDADFSAGTIFYMYTPFRGAMLRDVLQRLHAEGRRRAIRVCTYGPSMTEAMQQPALHAFERDPQPAAHVAIFRSLPG